MIIGQAVSDYSQISCSNLDMLPLADVTEFYGQVPGEAFFASVLAEFTRGELLSFFFFWPRCAACGILVPRPGTEPRPTAVKVWSPNHWTTRESPLFLPLSQIFCCYCRVVGVSYVFWIYMICKYFLSFSGLLFHSVDSVL